MSQRTWSQALRKKHGLKPGLSVRQQKALKKAQRAAEAAKRAGGATTPKTTPTPPRSALPPGSPQNPDEIFFQAGAPPAATEPEDVSGDEINPDPPASTSTQEEKHEEKTDPNLEAVEEIFTDEEIQEIFEMLWEDGANFFLKRLRRQLITADEAKRLGRLSFKVFKKRLGGKIQTLPETALFVYGALVLMSKEKADQPANNTSQERKPEYVPPSEPVPQKLLTPEEAFEQQRRRPS